MNARKIIASSIFLIAAAYEIWQIAVDQPWSGFTAGHSHLMSGLTVALWFGSILALALSREVWAVIGILAVFIHGAVISVGGHFLATGLYFLATVSLVLALHPSIKRSFTAERAEGARRHGWLSASHPR